LETAPTPARRRGTASNPSSEYERPRIFMMKASAHAGWSTQGRRTRIDWCIRIPFEPAFLQERPGAKALERAREPAQQYTA